MNGLKIRDLHTYTPQRCKNGFNDQTKADINTVGPHEHCTDCVLEPEENVSNRTFHIDDDPNVTFDCANNSVLTDSQIEHGHSPPTLGLWTSSSRNSPMSSHSEMVQEPFSVASSDVGQSGLNSEPEALGHTLLVNSSLTLGLDSHTTSDREEELYPGRNLKLQESQLLLEQFALTHHLSVSAHSDLSKVMATLLPSGNGFASRPCSSLLDDTIKRHIKVEHFLYCETCSVELPSETTGVCSGCGKRTKKPDVFSKLSRSDQITLKFQGK